MKKQESYTIWIETAYRLFAENGPEYLTINELAKQCKLPRTNFYYYFESKNDLIDEIILFHFKTTAEIFISELNNRLNHFIPDLYSVLYDFKLGLQFAKMLFKHRDESRFNEAHKKGVALSAYLIVPKFKVFFNINLPQKQVEEFWITVTDAWYSRLNFDDFSVDYLCNLCYEIMNTMMPLIEKNNAIASNCLFYSTPLSK